ncbi:unnamed protein product, partial [Effrenium voratum]
EEQLRRLTRRRSELQARLQPLTQEVLQWPLLMEPARAALQWASRPCEKYEAAALRHWMLQPAAGDWNIAVHLAEMDYEDIVYLEAAAREWPAHTRRAARFLAAAASRLDVGLFSQGLLEEAQDSNEGILLLFVIDGFEGSNGGRTKVGLGVDLCVFCDYEAMEAACLTAAGRRGVLQRLKAMADPNLRSIAVEELLPGEFREHFRNGLGQDRFCVGFEDEPCIFALTKTGGPAQTHRRGAAVCLFCDPVALGAKYDLAAGRREVARALKKMSPAAKHKILAERISADVKEEIEGLLRPTEPR